MIAQTSQPLPTLSPAVQALLTSERDILPQPEIVTARALARARESLHSQEVLTFSPRRTLMPLWRLVFAATACLLLAAGAAAAYQMLRHSHAVVPASPPPKTPSLQRAIEPTRDMPAAVEPATVAATVSPRVPGPGPRSASQEELGFLLSARQAGANGEHAKVLSILAQHERRFPGGRLSEEREVLRVKALLALGRKGMARQIAASFRHQFPRSVFLPKIEEMLNAAR